MGGGESGSAADRRAVMLERERKIRELEQRSRDAEEPEFNMFESTGQKPKKPAMMKIGGLKSMQGISSLGAVQPRDPELPVLVTPGAHGSSENVAPGNKDSDDD